MTFIVATKLFALPTPSSCSVPIGGKSSSLLNLLKQTHPMAIATDRTFRVYRKGGMTTLSWYRLEAASFDDEGRPIAFGLGGDIYRCGLDGTLQRISHLRSPDGERFNQAEVLLGKDKAQVWQRLRERVKAVLAKQQERHIALERFLRQDSLASQQQFLKLYGRISILPPDAYRAVVTNLTQGCSYNRCNFCTLYKDRPYLLKSEKLFLQHLEEVRDFFGEGLSYRRGVFLGEGNAGSLPTEVLKKALRQIQAILPDIGPASTFLDTFSNPLRKASEWRQLREAGLQRVYLGLESGSKKVLSLLGKPGNPARYRPLVERLKEAEISVGVILLSGVTHRELASEHVTETVAMLNTLPLHKDDRVFISEYLHNPSSNWSWSPRPRPEIRKETREILASLTLPRAPSGPGRTPYEVQGFLY